MSLPLVLTCMEWLSVRDVQTVLGPVSVHGVQGTCATVTGVCACGALTGARVGWAFSVPTSQSPLRLSGTEVRCD